MAKRVLWPPLRTCWTSRRRSSPNLSNERTTSVAPLRCLLQLYLLSKAPGKTSLRLHSIVRPIHTSPTRANCGTVAFLTSLLKDIRMERAKITEKDNVRLLFVTTLFLEFYIAIRDRFGEGEWPFLLVRSVITEEWVIWVLKRMREAADNKVNNIITWLAVFADAPVAEAMD